MLLQFAENRWRRWAGVVYYNKAAILWFLVLAVIAYANYHLLGMKGIALPIAPVSIIGVGLAIFLGFRNSSAYDRWWEARKIWGGIVNQSRSWAMFCTSFIRSSASLSEAEAKAYHKVLVHRHIAWLYALAMHLRKKMDTETIKPYLSEDEYTRLGTFKNIPAQLVNLQSKTLEEVWSKEGINDFRHSDLNQLLVDFYELQGKAERIKNTVFPYYYNFFTRMFLWLFLLILPFALVDTMGWECIPLSVCISFVFHILDKSGTITEEPFEGRAADTPMNTLCRTIEIDMRQMLGETDLPEPMKPKYTRFMAAYLD